MTPREYIISQIEGGSEIITNGYIIRMDEDELWYWMKQYANAEQDFLVKGIEWLRSELDRRVPGTDDLQGHCRSMLYLCKPLPF